MYDKLLIRNCLSILFLIYYCDPCFEFYCPVVSFSGPNRFSRKFLSISLSSGPFVCIHNRIIFIFYFFVGFSR